ncbi:MAG: sugar ABC transporter permease [Clostridia bacterium]|nr:sugar ABC transporter permease [Clostridia bacterium]
MKGLKNRYTSMQLREMKTGLLFTLPFIIGIVFFLALPLIDSFKISLGNINTANGYDIVVNGFENYKYMLEDVNYLEYLVDALKNTVINTPLIVIVSFVIAMLLKKEFVGRTFFRIIFFLPVILSSGVMAEIMVDVLIESIIDPTSASAMSKGALSGGQELVTNLLLSSDISAEISNYILYAQENISVVLSHSGIQILIFLAALQSISPSLYEASAIEGATAWENFWKITLPMVSPQLLVVVLFTVIDRFTDMGSKIMSYIYDIGFVKLRFGDSMAAAWVYFAIIGIIVLVLYFILKRFVFTYEER